MEKSFGVENLDTLGEAGSGQFEAIVSVFGNVDHDGDVVMPGAFKTAIEKQDPPPLVWSHFWNIPPIGETLDWSETEKGLRVKGQLFVGEGDKHQYADMVYAGMKSRDGRKPALREFSFQYQIPADTNKTGERDGKVVQELHELFPIGEVGPCLKGANPATELLMPPKARGQQFDRLEKIAKARGIQVEELLAELEESVRNKTYPPEVAALLLAAPDH